MSENYLITSAYAVPLNGETPAKIMYMPAGKSTIRANVNGKPKEISVNVTSKTADILQASLTELMAEPVEPFVDFDHKSEASAALPTCFKWTDQGVWMGVEWTSAGKSAIEGKAYRYFSPTFLLSEAGEPSALPDSGPVGALTNNPAFRKMKRITAAKAAKTADDEPANTKEKHMAEEATEQVTAALRSEVETLRAENKTLRETAETQRVEAINRDADLLIEAAVKDGKIAPKNETVKASLKRWAITDLAGAKAHIESLPVNPAFKTVVTVTSAHRDVGSPAGTASGDECKAIVKKIQASHEGMSWDDAWSIAESEYPEKFGKIKVAA
jgi:phage I-like protein